MFKSHHYKAALMVAVAGLLAATTASAQAAKAKGKATSTFKVTAPDLESKGRITAAHVYNSFGCTGQNISPALNWSNAPAGTKSFAVTAYDPDAPTGSGWWHWVMYNIPASATGLAAGAGTGRGAPSGSVQGMAMALSPGSGYFHAESRGCPTLVVARYISPTPRSSCWNVAIFFESGDQVSTGRSLFIQPALSVA